MCTTPASSARRTLTRALCALGLATLQTLAVAQTPAAAAERLEAAQQALADGHVGEAVDLLTRLADAGHTDAMERLALMHLYGETLYPSHRWSRETARQWLTKAALGGCEVARHLQAQAVRLAASR